jgi:hypothetical protein
MNTINSTAAAVGVGVELAPAVKRYFESTLAEMKVAGPSCNADFLKNLTKEVLEFMARAPTLSEPYKVRIEKENSNPFNLSL